MHRLNPKILRVGAIVIISLLVLFIFGCVLAYFKREKLLQSAVDKATLKAKRDYNLDVKIGSAHFNGLSTIAFANISVVPQGRDSLMEIKNFEVGVKIWPLLFGDIKLSSVKLEKGWLNLVNIHGHRNFDFLFKRKKDSTANATADMAKLANKLINDILYKIPDNLDLKNFEFKYNDDSVHVRVDAPFVKIENADLTSTFVVNGGQSTLHLSGKMRPSDKYIDVRLYADNHKVELPFLQKKFGLKLNFDTISTQLQKVEYDGEETRIYGSWWVKNLVINHPKLAAVDIVVPAGSIDANVFIGANYVSVDSSSVVHLKDLVVNPYLKYTTRPGKIYELKLHAPLADAQKIFNSFPSGIFDALSGIRVTGQLGYDLNLYLDASKPDSVQFNSALKQYNFRIIKYGQTDLTKLNNAFVYTPYEKDKPMPPRVIGTNNPYFTPITQISPNLQHAVMTAEDPSFYSHHGFVPEAIRKSIAIDFKEKKFKRGGSTISMQLVKNAFLVRQKTMSRKIEEIFIVWMIENQHLMTKDRMLEVYFNIIEWGHNVYGIGEASRYYFNKTPAELTVGESIYLASIVPKPKAGLYAFESDGSLKGYLMNYFGFIGNLMASRGFIARDSSNYYGYDEVRLKESLRRAVSPADSAKLGTDQSQDDDEGVQVIDPQNKPDFLQRLFGKKDTTHRKENTATKTDTTKTRKEIRQERRAARKIENDNRKKL